MLQPTTVAEALSILVPVDLSPASDEALLLAAQLAACSSQPLVILHIAHESVHQPNLYPRKTEAEQMLPIEEIAETMLQNYMARMREDHPDNEVLANAELRVVSGLPATRIPEIARQTGAGLIIMGGNGRTSLSKVLAGSVSEKVIRQSPVPVTVVHPGGVGQEHGSVEGRPAGGSEPMQVREPG